MAKIKLSLIQERHSTKPNKPGIISNRIARSPVAIELDDFTDVIRKIAQEGYTFAPATFLDGERITEKFEQQQLFALDFDNAPPKQPPQSKKSTQRKKPTRPWKPISPQEVMSRCREYDLPVLFMYETFSSTESQQKFRVVFLNDAPIPNGKLASDMNRILYKIFPEADQSCKDIARYFYGGKRLFYLNEHFPHGDTNAYTINVDTLIRSVGRYFKNNDNTGKHWKRDLRNFWKPNGRPDVSSQEDTEKMAGVDVGDIRGENGGNLPTTILLEQNIAHGRIPPKSTLVHYTQTTNKRSVLSAKEAPSVAGKNYHKKFRSGDLEEIRQNCHLFRDFVGGKVELDHAQLMGIGTNLIHVEGGARLFLKKCAQFPDLHSHDDPAEYWKSQLDEYKERDGELYSPMNCDNFCPYKDECPHGANILLTAHPMRFMMQRIPGYKLDLLPREHVAQTTYEAIEDACDALDTRIHVINSMTAIGKTRAYIMLMKERPCSRFLIAVPTLILRKEVFERARRKGIKVMMTPSVDELKGEIPQKVWNELMRLRAQGEPVVPYMNRIIASGKYKPKKIAALKEYLESKKKLETFEGSVITTHRYLLNSNSEWQSGFDTVVIDEDILFKAIVCDHKSITLKALCKLAKAIPALSSKVKEVLKCQDSGLLTLNTIDPCSADEVDLSGAEYKDFSLKDFCNATIFYVGRSKEEKSLQKDTVFFINPATLSEDQKYVIVSATASEEIYKSYFGSDRIRYEECPRAPYTGTLKQFHGLSMSRECLNNHEGLLNLLMAYTEITDKNFVITYMGYLDALCHFGNTEGLNELEGHDLLVVGSAYPSPIVCILAAAALGFDVSDTTVTRNKVVEHNGYRFKFTTYEDEDLRTVQFWMIESELEQAVGRARLLWHDCTVYLFSNFPLRQAEMHDGYDEVYGSPLQKPLQNVA